MISDAETKRRLAEFGRKYLWWEPIGTGSHSDDRIIAQTMNLGTLEDTIALEELVGASGLVELMKRVEPGWLSDRSWEFWRGRLSYRTGETLPDEPPRRSLDAAAL